MDVISKEAGKNIPTRAEMSKYALEHKAKNPMIQEQRISNLLALTGGNREMAEQMLALPDDKGQVKLLSLGGSSNDKLVPHKITAAPMFPLPDVT